MKKKIPLLPNNTNRLAKKPQKPFSTQFQSFVYNFIYLTFMANTNKFKYNNNKKRLTAIMLKIHVD